MSLTYLLIDVGCILIPLLASFYPKHPFYKEWKSLFLAITTVAIPFLIWDEFFTQHKVWGFNPNYLTGLYLGHLPIEEVLFFICIPYACTFTYFALPYLIKKNPLRKVDTLISYTLIIILTLWGIYYNQRSYTCAAFMATALFLAFCILKKLKLDYLYLAYFITLPFFFISNGILTGSGLEDPIVWYNNEENMGIRILTIPLEDSVYGFLLIASNIVFFDFFRAYFKNRLKN